MSLSFLENCYPPAIRNWGPHKKKMFERALAATAAGVVTTIFSVIAANSENPEQGIYAGVAAVFGCCGIGILASALKQAYGYATDAPLLLLDDGGQDNIGQNQP